MADGRCSSVVSEPYTVSNGKKCPSDPGVGSGNGLISLNTSLGKRIGLQMPQVSLFQRSSAFAWCSVQEILQLKVPFQDLTSYADPLEQVWNS